METRLGGDLHQASGALGRFAGYEIDRDSVQDAAVVRGILMLCADLLARHHGTGFNLIESYTKVARLLLDYNNPGCRPGSPAHLQRVREALGPFQQTLGWASRR